MNPNLVKNGKFYNTAKATLLIVSEYFCSYGHKRRAWYKSATGVYFQVYQYVKVPFNLKAFEDLTINVTIEKEEIIDECSFQDIQRLYEKADQDGKVGLNSGPYSYCVLRRSSSPSGKLAIANRPTEFSQIIEV
jgi:hypothetical protein